MIFVILELLKVFKRDHDFSSALIQVGGPVEVELTVLDAILIGGIFAVLREIIILLCVLPRLLHVHYFGVFLLISRYDL